MHRPLFCACFFAFFASFGCGSKSSSSPPPGGEPATRQLWGAAFAGTGEATGYGVGEDATGATIVVGAFGGTVDFGNGAIDAKGMRDAFVAKLDAQGHVVWGRAFGDASEQGAVSAAVDPSGNVVVLGSFAGHVDFDGASIDGHGEADDVFLAKLDAQGHALWAHGYGGPSTQDGYEVAIDREGNIVHTGGTSGTIDFGTGPL